MSSGIGIKMQREEGAANALIAMSYGVQGGADAQAMPSQQELDQVPECVAAANDRKAILDFTALAKASFPLVDTAIFLADISDRMPKSHYDEICCEMMKMMPGIKSGAHSEAVRWKKESAMYRELGLLSRQYPDAIRKAVEECKHERRVILRRNWLQRFSPFMEQQRDQFVDSLKRPVSARETGINAPSTGTANTPAEDPDEEEEEMMKGRRKAAKLRWAYHAQRKEAAAQKAAAETKVPAPVVDQAVIANQPQPQNVAVVQIGNVNVIAQASNPEQVPDSVMQQAEASRKRQRDDEKLEQPQAKKQKYPRTAATQRLDPVLNKMLNACRLFTSGQLADDDEFNKWAASNPNQAEVLVMCTARGMYVNWKIDRKETEQYLNMAADYIEHISQNNENRAIVDALRQKAQPWL